jgi:hypothetical protein
MVAKNIHELLTEKLKEYEEKSQCMTVWVKKKGISGIERSLRSFTTTETVIYRISGSIKYVIAGNVAKPLW